MNKPGNAIVQKYHSGENKNDQNDKVLTRWHKLPQLPGATALHIQCNNSQTHHNKDQQNDKKAFHCFLSEPELFLQHREIICKFPETEFQESNHANVNPISPTNPVNL